MASRWVMFFSEETPFLEYPHTNIVCLLSYGSKNVYITTYWVVAVPVNMAPIEIWVYIV